MYTAIKNWLGEYTNLGSYLKTLFVFVIMYIFSLGGIRETTDEVWADGILLFVAYILFLSILVTLSIAFASWVFNIRNTKKTE